jgi:hypothetical protein
VSEQKPAAATCARPGCGKTFIPDPSRFPPRRYHVRSCQSRDYYRKVKAGAAVGPAFDPDEAEEVLALARRVLVDGVGSPADQAKLYAQINDLFAG